MSQESPILLRQKIMKKSCQDIDFFKAVMERSRFYCICPIKNKKNSFQTLIFKQTRLGQLGANISPDRSSLTPQVLIGNFLKHNYPLLYELQQINLLCLYLPKEDGVSPDAEY